MSFALLPVRIPSHILQILSRQHIYGHGSYEAGQYPSPYQARHRVHSKHGSRGYKRRANSSAGGDGGVPAAFAAGGGGGGGGAGVGLGLASSNSHPRGRSERDRFLVDINGGGQRSGATPNALLHARTNVGGVLHSGAEELFDPSTDSYKRMHGSWKIPYSYRSVAQRLRKRYQKHIPTSTMDACSI